MYKKIKKVISILVIAFLLLVIISALIKYDFSPKTIWQNAKIALGALYVKYRFELAPLSGKEKYEIYEDLWFKTNYKRSGVTSYNREKSYKGLTLYSNHEARAFLIDMEGNVVYEWAKPFSEVWKAPKHVSGNVSDNLAFWRKVRVFPNGDIIAIYEGINQYPYGLGIIKLDRESNLIWKVPINAHHDFDIDPQGNIYVLYHEYQYIPVFKKPIIVDGFAIISPRGKLLRKVSFLPIFYIKKYKDIFPWDELDPFHTNNLEFLDADRAKQFPGFDEGDIMVSMVGPSAVFVLDHKTFKPKWGIWGHTTNQHDPDFLKNGQIRIFDNNGNRNEAEGKTKIVDIDPATLKTGWTYKGTREEPFYSINRGSQQTLPNGNVLITESTGGRIFEITPEGEIVWEFVSRALEGNSIGLVNWAKRYNRENLPFLEQK